MRQQLFGAVLIGGFQVKFQISAEIGKACDILLKFALFSVIQLRIVGCGNAAEIRPGQRGKGAVRNPSASAPEAGEKTFSGIPRLETDPFPGLSQKQKELVKFTEISFLLLQFNVENAILITKLRK